MRNSTYTFSSWTCFLPEVLYERPSPAQRSRVTSLGGRCKGAIDLGYGSGQLPRLPHHLATISASVYALEGGQKPFLYELCWSLLIFS